MGTVRNQWFIIETLGMKERKECGSWPGVENRPWGWDSNLWAEWSRVRWARGENVPQECYSIHRTDRQIWVRQKWRPARNRVLVAGSWLGNTGPTSSQGEMLNWVAKTRARTVDYRARIWRHFGWLCEGGCAKNTGPLGLGVFKLVNCWVHNTYHVA